jgi:hypothetical protein
MLQQTSSIFLKIVLRPITGTRLHQAPELLSNTQNIIIVLAVHAKDQPALRLADSSKRI